MSVAGGAPGAWGCAPLPVGCSEGLLTQGMGGAAQQVGACGTTSTAVLQGVEPGAGDGGSRKEQRERRKALEERGACGRWRQVCQDDPT